MLRSGTNAEAEAAAARLVVLGARAVPHVLQSLTASGSDTEAARLVAVLGQLPPSRDVVVALDAALHDPRRPVSTAALAAWGALLSAANAAVAAQALDRLTAIALDGTLDGEPRARATGWLAALPGDEIRPLLARLAADPVPEVRLAATSQRDTAAESPFSPGAGPDVVRQFVHASGNTAPLPDLHRLVVLARERAAAAPVEAPEWTAARAAVHQALAQRGSTVALYDLREMLLRGDAPLPVAALSALATVGDASCVDAMAEAYDRLDDQWTREQLARALEAIVARERPARRPAVVKRLSGRNHPLLAGLAAKRPK